MSQVNVDPRAQVIFARDLHREVAVIRQRQDDVGRSLDDLRKSGAWADSVQEEYQRSFRDASEAIDVLMRNARVYCEYLERQAALAERYLRLGQRRV